MILPPKVSPWDRLVVASALNRLFRGVPIFWPRLRLSMMMLCDARRSRRRLALSLFRRDIICGWWWSASLSQSFRIIYSRRRVLMLLILGLPLAILSLYGILFFFPLFEFLSFVSLSIGSSIPFRVRFPHASIWSPLMSISSAIKDCDETFFFSLSLAQGLSFWRGLF